MMGSYDFAGPNMLFRIRTEFAMGMVTSDPRALARITPMSYSVEVPQLPRLVPGRKVRWRTWWGSLHRTRADALRARAPW